MTWAAQCLQIRRIVRVAAPVERPDVIALKATGATAPDTPPRITLENPQSEARPPLTIECSVMPGTAASYAFVLILYAIMSHVS